MKRRRIFAPGLVCLIVLWVAGCARSSAPAPDLGPPEGWRGDEARWWRADLDTTGVFRDLETLRTMDLMGEDVTYAASRTLAEQSGVAHQQLARAVKQSLIRLFRNQPEVVDSLFEQYVSPKIARARVSGDSRKLVNRFKRVGYQTIRRHFLEPRTIRKLGADIPVPYPDSLRERRIGGKVRLQVFINEKGEPVAVEKLEGVHPVLDAIAMRATTEMRWQPAYLLRGGKSDPLPSWTRFKVNFNAPETP
jgi:hypothetical protein